MLRLLAIKRVTRQEILRLAVPELARRGYELVSMSAIAAAVGVRRLAPYHHFQDTRSLDMAVMAYSSRDRLQLQPTAALVGDEPPLVRLRCLVATLVRDPAGDPERVLLLRRQRTDGNETRSTLLVDQLFAPSIQTPTSPVLHLFDSLPIAPLIPGWKSEHADPDLLTRGPVWPSAAHVRSGP